MTVFSVLSIRVVSVMYALTCLICLSSISFCTRSLPSCSRSRLLSTAPDNPFLWSASPFSSRNPYSVNTSCIPFTPCLITAPTIAFFISPSVFAVKNLPSIPIASSPGSTMALFFLYQPCTFSIDISLSLTSSFNEFSAGTVAFASGGK